MDHTGHTQWRKGSYELPEHISSPSSALRLIYSPETEKAMVLRGRKGSYRRESHHGPVRGYGCRLTASFLPKKNPKSQTSPPGFLHPSCYCSLLTLTPGRNWNYPAVTLLTLVFPPACQSVLRFMIYLELDYTEAQGQHSLIRHRPLHGHTQTFVLAASASLAPEQGRPLLIAMATTSQVWAFFPLFLILLSLPKSTGIVKW